MRELLAAQADFAAALRDAGAAPAAAAAAARWLAGDPAKAASRLAIHRANVAASIARALTAAYPVVRQVVGDEFFDALARAHLAAHPSTSGDLDDYGATFPDFVAAFPHTQELPYLADLARLEWAVHRAYGAADGPPVDPARLAATPPARQGALRLGLAAGTAVVEAAHPIVQLWRIHQPGHDGAFAVDWTRGERALVAREGLRVAVDALDAGEAAFVRALLAGDDFAHAAAAALAVDERAALGPLIGRLLATGRVVSVSLPEET